MSARPPRATHSTRAAASRQGQTAGPAPCACTCRRSRRRGGRARASRRRREPGCPSAPALSTRTQWQRDGRFVARHRSGAAVAVHSLVSAAMPRWRQRQAGAAMPDSGGSRPVVGQRARARTRRRQAEPDAAHAPVATPAGTASHASRAAWSVRPTTAARPSPSPGRPSAARGGRPTPTRAAAAASRAIAGARAAYGQVPAPTPCTGQTASSRPRLPPWRGPPPRRHAEKGPAPTTCRASASARTSGGSRRRLERRGGRAGLGVRAVRGMVPTVVREVSWNPRHGQPSLASMPRARDRPPPNCGTIALSLPSARRGGNA